MSELLKPIYLGWSTRHKIGGAIKRTFINFGRSGEGKAAAKLGNELADRLIEIGLNTKEGRLDLADEIATRILESFADENVDVSKLEFHAHLKKFSLNLIEYEELFELPSSLFDESLVKKSGMFSTPSLPRSELWKIEDELNNLKSILDNFSEVMGFFSTLIHRFVEPIIKANPSLVEGSLEASFSQSNVLKFNVPLAMTLNELPELIEMMVGLPHVPELEDPAITTQLKKRTEYNVILASGGNPADPGSFNRNPTFPTKFQYSSIDQLIKTYLDGTPMVDLLDFNVPIEIPNQVRFEHHHIVAGSGHGKTQALQHLILHDLKSVEKGSASIVVLDSQGDLIKNIAGLKIFAPGSPMADRLIVIDPTDVEYPVALNLFDVGVDRINQYSLFDRERLINGVLELYDYVLGSLLSAEMSQKQSVIFRYIMRLMLQIPNATIHTLRELLDEGGSDKYRKFIDKLEGSSKAFFETEFDSKEFVGTKRQVVRRLWGILENQTFERMFSHPKNKLDLFSELNSGKVILINTSKDLLKQNGTEIFGRFFIAMIAQVAQERAAIAEEKRMPTYVYIDEAQDYFDKNIDLILSQARKYKVGMIMAHQYLGQLNSQLQQAMSTNTSIKFAGGMSSKDATAIAAEMRTNGQFIEAQDKLSFATYVRGVTQTAISMSIKYGAMESMDKMNDAQLTQTRQYMRDRFAVHYTEAGMAAQRSASEGPEVAPDNSGNTTITQKVHTKEPLSDDPADW